MEFEFDPRKSRTNKKKHGIDFVEAQSLWDDPDLVEVPAKTTDEPRFLVVGMIAEEHWSGIITYRDENIRIISVRRSRPEEVAHTKAKDLEKKFDAGEDITKHLDIARARRPEHEQRRVNVDFPVWMIQSLDKEAQRLGVPRQSLIKMLIAEHIEKVCR